MKIHARFLIILIMIFALFCENIPSIVNAYIDNSNPFNQTFTCYKYFGEVPHFFTHQIINNPQKAFNSKLAKHYDKDCITHFEFENFLNEMYSNGYCLVDIYDIVGYENNIPYFKDVFVPLNKKPFLLSFDDMSYDTQGQGLSDRIILDENGNFASLTKSNTPQIEYDKEAICILESFILSHPDFSHNNARAIICPTGYNGILGYRINKDNQIDRETEIEKIHPLVEKLKQKKYHFACHTFNHIQVSTTSNHALYLDLKRYKEEIEPVIGKTDILSFPYGSKVDSGSKLDIIKSFGYNIFFLVGDGKNYVKNNVIFLKRNVLNGVSLRKCRNEYLPYFDTKNIYDNKRTIAYPY